MPELANPLGEPYILKPEDFIALDKASGYVAGTRSMLPTMTAISEVGTSLVDNAYAQQMAYQKAQADLSQSLSRTKYQDAQTDNLKQQGEQSAQLFPLEIQGQKQKLQQGQFALKEAQRQSDELDKANGEYEAWHTELSNLDPTDPDYDSKVAAINAKYPHASTNPSTQRLITPLFQQQNVKRSQSAQVQQRTDQITQLQDFQKKGLLQPDTDVRAEVNGGNGQNQINSAKQQATINRLQNVTAYGNVQQRMWAQNEIDRITGKGLGPGETPDRTMFAPNGDLNPGTEALLSQIERSFMPAPGVTKEIKTETGTLDQGVEGSRTTTTIKGEPVRPSDLTPTNQNQPTTLEAPKTQEDMLKDPDFQQVWDDAANGRIQLPAGAKPGTPEFAAAVMAEYAARKQLKSNAAAPKNTIKAAPSPAVPSRVPGPERAKKTSYQGPSQQDTDLAIRDSLNRGSGTASTDSGIPTWWRPENSENEGPKLSLSSGYARGAGDSWRTSNNDYRAPENAPDALGINKNVWANVMAEEGPAPGMDGKHPSVFGLWADAPGQEGEAYRQVMEAGPHSAEAFNAVTSAWTNVFLKQSQPWKLNSPGLQELVIADSQHRGGESARNIIDEMGGFDAVNKMNPTEAINTYSELRKPLWPGNNTPFRDGATDRVTRERQWALEHQNEVSDAGNAANTGSEMPIHESGHPMPRTPREALTLGPGTRFMAPDGTLRMVPNQYA